MVQNTSLRLPLNNEIMLHCVQRFLVLNLNPTSSFSVSSGLSGFIPACKPGLNV